MMLLSFLSSKPLVDGPEGNRVCVQANDKYLSACVIGEAAAANRELHAVRLYCKPKLFYCVISPACSHGDRHRSLCLNNSKNRMFDTCIFSSWIDEVQV